MSDQPVVPPRPKSRSADDSLNTPAVPSRRPVKSDGVTEASDNLNTPQVPKRPQKTAPIDEKAVEIQDIPSEQKDESSSQQTGVSPPNAGLNDTPPLPTKRPTKQSESSELDDTIQSPPVPATRPTKSLNDGLAGEELNVADAKLEQAIQDQTAVPAEKAQGGNSEVATATGGDSNNAPKMPASRPQKKAVANVEEFDFEQPGADEKEAQHASVAPAPVVPSSRPVKKSPEVLEGDTNTNAGGEVPKAQSDAVPSDDGEVKPSVPSSRPTSKKSDASETDLSLASSSTAQEDVATRDDEPKSSPTNAPSDQVIGASTAGSIEEQPASDSQEIKAVELKSPATPSKRPLRVEESLQRKADPVPHIPIETAAVETVDDAKEVSHSDSVAAALTETVEAAKDQVGERLEHKPLKVEAEIVDSPQPSEDASEASPPSIESPSATKLGEDSILEKGASAIVSQAQLEGEKQKEQERVEELASEAQPVPARPNPPQRSSTSESTESQKSLPSVPKRPARRPEPKEKEEKAEQVKEEKAEQTKESKSRPAPPPKPKNLPVGSRIGALRASLFSDLNNVISSGFKAPPPPPKKIETGEAKVYESQGTQQEEEPEKKDDGEDEQVKQTKLAPTSSRPRAKGPKRRLPTAAKSEWSTAVADVWHMNMVAPLDTAGDDVISREAAKESQEAIEKSRRIQNERTKHVMDLSLAADKRAEEAVTSQESLAESQEKKESNSEETKATSQDDDVAVLSPEVNQSVEDTPDRSEKSVPEDLHFITDDLKKNSDSRSKEDVDIGEENKDEIDPSVSQVEEEHEAVKNISSKEGAELPIEPTDVLSDLSEQDVKDISREKKELGYQENSPKESKIPAEEEGEEREEAIKEIKQQFSDEMEGEVDKSLDDTIKKAATESSKALE